MKLLFTAVLYLLLPFCLFAQFSPKENSQLHYRIIGFYTPEATQGNALIEIAMGNLADNDSFSQNVVVTHPLKGAKNTIEVPKFGAEYTWRVVKQGKAGSLRHFSTLTSKAVDTAQARIRITQPATAHQDGFMFLDRTKVLYDMTGAPVWFMPEIPGIMEANTVARDIKVSPQGTITFVGTESVTEISWDGEVLWRGPNDGIVARDTSERYHHEFTRLKNGHYMVCGNELIEIQKELLLIEESERANMPPVEPKPENAPVPPPPIQAPIPRNGSTQVPPPEPQPQNIPQPQMPQQPESQQPGIGQEGFHPQGTKLPRRMVSPDGKAFKCSFGTIIEYDQKGKVVWSWKSFPVFKSKDLKNHTKTKVPLDTHENSFYFDEKNKFVYVSFKNASQIVKIQYPSGKVVAEYGKRYRAVMHDTTKALFCDQHSIRISRKGYLYMFNNNLCNLDRPFHVPMFKETQRKDAPLETVWKYECPIDWTLLKNNTRPPTTTGGNALELSDGSMFISACSPFAGLYLVSESKKLLWSGVSENWNASQKKWDQAALYRASIVENRQKLEQMIWGGKP